MYLRELTPVIQSSVTPVLMISGVALILLSMTNRYGRVIDNARRLMGRAHHSTGDERAYALAEVRIMYDRCRSLRVSILLACGSILFMAFLVGLLFVANLFQIELTGELASLFIGSVLFLAASLIIFVADMNVSLRVLAMEVKQLTETPPPAQRIFKTEPKPNQYTSHHEEPNSLIP